LLEQIDQFGEGIEIKDGFFSAAWTSKTQPLYSQYIATLNQNQVNTLFSESKEFIEQHLIITLTDDAESGKLLGITVEIEYD
jgi:hypothetical protein